MASNAMVISLRNYIIEAPLTRLGKSRAARRELGYLPMCRHTTSPRVVCSNDFLVVGDAGVEPNTIEAWLQPTCRIRIALHLNRS